MSLDREVAQAISEGMNGVVEMLAVVGTEEQTPRPDWPSALAAMERAFEAVLSNQVPTWTVVTREQVENVQRLRPLVATWLEVGHPPEAVRALGEALVRSFDLPTEHGQPKGLMIGIDDDEREMTAESLRRILIEAEKKAQDYPEETFYVSRPAAAVRVDVYTLVEPRFPRLRRHGVRRMGACFASGSVFDWWVVSRVPPPRHATMSDVTAHTSELLALLVCCAEADGRDFPLRELRARVLAAMAAGIPRGARVVVWNEWQDGTLMPSEAARKRPS